MLFRSKKHEIRFTRGTFRPRWSVLKPIIAIGAAPCIVNTAGCAINAIINNTVYRYGGDSGVAAIGIFTTFTQLLVTFVIGVCMGMQPIVGYNYGAGRFDRLKRAFWLSAAVCSSVCLLGSLLCQLAPGVVTRLFTDDAALIETSNHALRLTTWMFWVVGFQIVITNFFQSLGEAGKSIFMSLIRQVLFLLPMLFIFPHFWGLSGVWLSFPLSDLAATIVSVILLVIVMRKITRLAAQESTISALE